MNIMLAGGGTGGHVYPALALAEAFQRHDPATRLVFVGSGGGMEARLVPASGIPFVGLAVRPPRSLAPLRVAWSGATAVLSLGQAVGAVARFRPAAVIATGGIAALPPVLAAAVLNAPVVVLEGNAVPGRTNRILARYSRVVAVASEAAASRLPAGRTAVTGLPVRREVLAATRDDGLRAFGLAPDRRTVLVVGGSQGAARLNRAVEEAVGRLAPRRDLQILHQIGRGWSGAAPDRPAPARADGVGYVRLPYLERIGAAYACADLVVSRCGANALAEITACGLPSILVPYPYAADDHQSHNAAPLVAAGAASLLRDEALTGEALAGEITALVDAPPRLRAMAAASRGQGRPDAAERIVALVERIAHPVREEVCG